MKKFSVLFAMVFVCFATSSMAQQRNWSPEDMAKMKEKRKTMLIDSLSITSAVADSVLSIEDSSRNKMMDLRKNGVSREDMRSQFQSIQEQKNAEVKKVLSTDAYSKYLELEESNRKQMRNRMGGGGRPSDN